MAEQEPAAFSEGVLDDPRIRFIGELAAQRPEGARPRTRRRRR
jgi:hypothetical protein